VYPDRLRIERTAQAQGPGERSTAHGEFETGRIAMQPRTAPAQPVARIGDHGPAAVDLGRHHSQQDGPVSTLPAPQAHPLRLPSGALGHAGLSDRATGRTQSSPTADRFIPRYLRVDPRDHPAADPSAAAPDPVWPSSRSPSVSGRMSIRQPVSFAASRAFWPSLPIASESW
jgi:hypothetical protein